MFKKQIFPQFECKSNGIVFTLDNMNDRIVLFSSRKCSNYTFKYYLVYERILRVKTKFLITGCCKN